MYVFGPVSGSEFRERAKQFYIHATENNVQACLICRYDALVNDHVNRLVSNYSTYSAIYDLND